MPSDDGGADSIAAGLAAAMTLLERELERLQLDLETHRLIEHPNRDAIVRQLIADIEYRQDTLDQLRQSAKAATAT